VSQASPTTFGVTVVCLPFAVGKRESAIYIASFGFHVLIAPYLIAAYVTFICHIKTSSILKVRPIHEYKSLITHVTFPLR